MVGCDLIGALIRGMRRAWAFHFVFEGGGGGGIAFMVAQSKDPQGSR